MHQHHDHHDHGHGDFGPQGELEGLALEELSTEIEGLEMFTIRSVGIDIGSSTTHLVFSRLTLRREGAAFSSKFTVTGREVLYRSRIMLTPYSTGILMDTEKIRDFVEAAYSAAELTPGEVDTGAVVVTGEALKKENARPIAELFAQASGRFICVSAGANHEALLAAYGCGAVALSNAENATVLNIDVGGGTTKFSLIRQGQVTGTAAIELGARLIAYDESGTITRLEEPAKVLLAQLGYSTALGQPITDALKDEFAELMASVLLEVATGGPFTPLAQSLLLTGPLPGYRGPSDVDRLVFSGGVSEYIYGHDSDAYGDVGPQFARRIRERVLAAFGSGVVQESEEGIRATVIGAGEYTIQASGSTSHLSGLEALPAFGLKVVRPLLEAGDSVESAVAHALVKFDLDGFGPGLALALTINETPNYKSLRRLAEGISAVTCAPNADPSPLFIVVDMDIAKSLGGILKEELGLEQAVVVVDGIEVGDLDYLDIGRPLGVSEVVPVTVKSLVFPTSAGDG